jgi:sugar phosphate isomerase/epimerase
MPASTLDRRSFLCACAAASVAAAQAPASDRKPTQFQIACMTLPYQNYSFERALTGLKGAGYRYVAWYLNHKEDGKQIDVLPLDAPAGRAKELAKRCADLGLESVMTFANARPEDVPGLTKRIRQAGAAGVGQVLVMGNTRGNDAKVWVKNFKQLGPIARDQNVIVVAKQHGGNTGTGAALAEIIREVADDNIKISYDAGNVMDYHKIDPLPDIAKCADQVRSFCIKDHRLTPKDQDCGPGFGEIDHYRLLGPVAWTGRDLPLCCENLSAPVIPPPADPSGVDALARRAREFLEVVIAGLQA